MPSWRATKIILNKATTGTIQQTMSTRKEKQYRQPSEAQHNNEPHLQPTFHISIVIGSGDEREKERMKMKCHRRRIHFVDNFDK
jgi:hypothetical protein